MDSLRRHQWVNAGHKDLPERIIPQNAGIGELKSITKMVSSISHDEHYTIVTIRKPNDVSEKPNVQKWQRGRRKSSQVVTLTKSPQRFSQFEDGIPENDLPTLPDKIPKGRSSSEVMGPDSFFKMGDSRNLFGRKRHASVQIELRPIQNQIFLSSGKEEDTFRRMSAHSTVLGLSIASPIQEVELPELEQADIETWHRVHRPPNSIRSMPLTFRKGSTSSQDPAIIFQDLHRALIILKASLKSNFEFDRNTDRYLFLCSHRLEDEELIFELEICRIWAMSYHGLQSKKLKGDSILYQNLVSRIIDHLQWKT
jgi:hypothetical protein